MQRLYNITLALFVSLCLILYSSIGMAHTQDTAGFAIEICADGVAKTVVLNPEGSPVETPEACSKCNMCCQVIFVLASLGRLAGVFDLPDDISLGRWIVPNIIVTKHNTFPVPRGPPAAQDSRFIRPSLSKGDHPVGHNMQSAGRSLFKDAIA
ncbi:hypothetical protein PHIN109289_19180 [Phaeobacter inhibens]|uniref:DUF2946 domain-containing protein n=1 Tax=Phaeobacter piscinae TaxID=1580596 RepID=A0AAN1LCF7_9RHOB|nr:MULTISPECIES: hypothetical protein [Phaeobacter]ATG45570.1 hypothetical protein PhaeoP13_03688 [Phaeobacter piscinae]